MKTTLPTIAIAAICCLPCAAQVAETDRKMDPSGDVTTITFNPETQTNIIRYFHTYKDQRFGLPPEWVTTMRVKEIPATWRTARINPGMLIADRDRSYLYAAPPELIKVLPPAASGVKYYIAGSNVVAVDSGFRVVDSIQIPSVKIESE